MFKDDPTKGIAKKVRQILNNKATPDFLKEATPPSFCAAPLLFGTCKTHKPGVNIRPMVSRGTHPLVNFEKCMQRRFHFITKEHPYRVSSSVDVVNRLKNLNLTKMYNTFSKYQIRCGVSLPFYRYEPCHWDFENVYSAYGHFHTCTSKHHH